MSKKSFPFLYRSIKVLNISTDQGFSITDCMKIEKTSWTYSTPLNAGRTEETEINSILIAYEILTNEHGVLFLFEKSK